MDITPTTHVLKALRRKGITHGGAFAELIDNSFDAKATRVSIEMNGSGRRGRIVVTDNGRGVAAKSIKHMLTLGSHGEGNDAGLGVYGVGFNYAALNLADEVEIVGISRGMYVQAMMDWEAAYRSGCWITDDPSERPATDDDRGHHGVAESGTWIAFSKLIHKQSPTGQNFADMCENLRFMFTPALRSGLQITIKPSVGRVLPLTPVAFPEFEESVEAELSVVGRRVLVKAGITKDGVYNRFRGFALAFRHRWVRQSSAFCGDAPAARIAGEITLVDDAWRSDLADMKTDLVRHQGELIDAVQEACADLFRKATGQARMLRVRGLAARAEGIANEGNSGGRDDRDEADSKAKRGDGDTTGTSAPTGTGSPHTRAKNTQPGKTFGARKRPGMRIEFAPLVGACIGEADAPAVRVTLNENNPYIKHIQAADDAYSVAAVAVALLAHEESMAGGGQRVFKFSGASFAEIVGRVLTSYKDPNQPPSARAIA